MISMKVYTNECNFVSHDYLQKCVFEKYAQTSVNKNR